MIVIFSSTTIRHNVISVASPVTTNQSLILILFYSYVILNFLEVQAYFIFNHNIDFITPIMIESMKDDISSYVNFVARPGARL